MTLQGFLSRYVTFSKVEEATRCIQVVNGFTLDGRSLKACFGAARYCESWLKKKPCKNRNCIYLHAMGAPEDTCIKDEVLAICSSKLLQLGINMDYYPRRSGSCFPPPVENSKHNITTSKTLTQSAKYGKCHSFKDGHQGKSDFLQETPRGQEVSFGRASYLNVVSHGLQSDSKGSGNSLSSKHEKVQIAGQSSSKDNKELGMVKNHRLIPDRFQEKLASEKPYLKNNHSESPVSQDTKIHVDIDSLLKDSGSKLSPFSENDAWFQTFVQEPHSSVRVESTKQQSYSHDSVDCLAGMRLENEVNNDYIFRFVPVSPSSKQITSTSEFDTSTANQTIGTALIFRNVPLTADQFARPLSSASCISTTQLEAENRPSLFDIQKVENNPYISPPFSSDCVMRSLKVEQDNFQIQGEPVGCRRETSKLLQVDLQSMYPTSKDHIHQYSLSCQKEDVNSKVVGIRTCKVDEGSREVDIISDLLSLNHVLNDSIPDDSNLDQGFHNSSNSRHPSEVFSPGILCNNYASKFSFSRIDMAGHSSNGLWQKENAYQPDTFEGNLNSSNKPLDAFIAGLNDYSDVQSSDYPSDTEIANNSNLLHNVHKSDSLALTGGEYQLFRVPSKKILMSAPPGFSRPATYQNKPHCIPQTSATVFTQGKLPQPAKIPIVSNIDSNLLHRSNIDQRFTFQSKFVNTNPGLTAVGQNNVNDMALQDASINYCGVWSSCNVSSFTAPEPVLLVRGSDSSLEESSRSNLANSHYGYSRQFHDHEECNFQLPDASCFYNVALEQI